MKHEQLYLHTAMEKFVQLQLGLYLVVNLTVTRLGSQLNIKLETQ